MSQSLMTIRQAAEQLAVHPETLRVYLREGKLVGIRVGGRWRIRPEALENFLRQREVSA